MARKQQALGNQGESLAEQHLIKNGYQILTRNWHCQYGEIDIVAQAGEFIVFVEVKTRSSHNTDSAFAAITHNKREKMIKSAQQYLAENDLDEAAWRIDVIGIALPYQQAAIIEHVEDALDW